MERDIPRHALRLRTALVLFAIARVCVTLGVRASEFLPPPRPRGSDLARGRGGGCERQSGAGCLARSDIRMGSGPTRCAVTCSVKSGKAGLAPEGQSSRIHGESSVGCLFLSMDDR